MKAGKIVVALLAVSMAMPFCACKKKTTKVTEETTKESSSKTSVVPTQTETEPSESETEPTTEPTSPTSIEDQSEEPLIVYGYDKDFGKILNTYLTDVEYEYVYVEPDAYFATLNEALQGEEKRPDLFMMDASHLGEWAESEKTLAVNQLGISNSDLYDQFEYSYEMAVDKDHAVKALAFEIAPSVIIYNRALAAQTIGVYEPADVASLLADWQSILDLAHDVNINSEGAVKLLADRQQLHDVFWAGHDDAWSQDGKVVVGSDFDQYILLQESLFAESLTGEKEPFSREWRSDINTDMTVMFFGSLQTAADVIGYVPGHEEKPETNESSTGSSSDSSDPTAETTTEEPEITGWSIVPAPSATYDGGTWLMVSSSCDQKATAAHVLRVLTLDSDTLTGLAVDGRFVNSRSIMKRCADDPNFISDFLGGQNPYAILVPEAEKIRIPSDPQTDRYADSEIKRLLDAYLAGDILTPEEFREQFVIGMEELLGLH
ncbi:MAG: extracellular solute-binding protein [Clostridiales bacterium]|nr:extracellular solute-binding protein [Clostridiales bacterium]